MASGIQNKNEIKLDLVYTRLGRLYKMTNDPRQRVVKYAFSDDGINYNLYNAESETDDGKDKLIRETPQFDTWTDENSLMRNKLITMDRDISTIPTLSVSPEDVSIVSKLSANKDRRLTTVNISIGVPAPNGFKVTLFDISYLFINQPPTFTGTLPVSSGYNAQAPTIVSKDKNNLYILKSEGNTMSQTWNLSGSSQAPSISSFNLIYDTDYSEYLLMDVNLNPDVETKHETSILIESNDGYGSVTIPVTLRRAP